MQQEKYLIAVVTKYIIQRPSAYSQNVPVNAMRYVK